LRQPALTFYVELLPKRVAVNVCLVCHAVVAQQRVLLLHGFLSAMVQATLLHETAIKQVRRGPACMLR
jgi:hypothetical protein